MEAIHIGKNILKDRLHISITTTTTTNNTKCPLKNACLAQITKM